MNGLPDGCGTGEDLTGIIRPAIQGDLHGTGILQFTLTIGIQGPRPYT